MAPRSRLRFVAVLPLTLALVATPPGVSATTATVGSAHSTQAPSGAHAQVASGTLLTTGAVPSLADRETAMGNLRPQLIDPSDPLAELTDGRAVDAGVLGDLLQAKATDPWLNGSVSITVRDVVAEREVLDLDADRETVPASLTKIVAAAAVVTTMPGHERLQTRVMQGTEAHQIVLVAGGDSLLAAGAGDPGAVVGRAGLGDLAAQVADVLPRAPEGARQYEVVLDTTYAEGPDKAPEWTEHWVDFGYTGRITMLGLAQNRAVPGVPAPPDPAAATAVVFADALRQHGLAVRSQEAEDVVRLEAAATGDVLAQVSSAPVRDLIALALSDSDNALTEQLSRQAAVRAGEGTGVGEVADWVRVRVREHYGIDTTGVELADTSGLSPGTTIPMRVIADLLVLGAEGGNPDLQNALSRLPIAGYTGTLRDRFHLSIHDEAIGVARAKTGSLPGISALGGYVVTDNGRLLAFAVVADEVGPDGAVLEARSVLDEMVAVMAACGC